MLSHPLHPPPTYAFPWRYKRDLDEASQPTTVVLPYFDG